ncbi:MAG TPA: PAS domain-containing protein [Methanospirillum sp.]|nr:PAS domain-containing protein [Methanospirillum sp.]
MRDVPIHYVNTKEMDHKFNYQDTILNAMPIPIITTNRDLTILSVNTATIKMLDMPSEAILGTQYDLLFQITDSKNSDCIALEAIRKFQPVSGRATAYIRGRTVPVDYGAIPVTDEQGQIISVVNYMVDRSERQLFNEEVAFLGERIQAGTLDSRADITNFSEPYRSMLSTINGMLDTLTLPLLGFKYAITQIARGENPVPLISNTEGELGDVIIGLNSLLISPDTYQVSPSPLFEGVDQLTIILEMIRLDLQLLGHRLQAGDFEARVETQDYEGCTKIAIETLNEGLACSEKTLSTISRFLSQVRIQGSIYG